MKIDLGKNELIHFVGIGGIGMSGLALIMNGYFYSFLKVVVMSFVKMLRSILKWGNYSERKIEKNI